LLSEDKFGSTILREHHIVQTNALLFGLLPYASIFQKVANNYLEGITARLKAVYKNFNVARGKCSTEYRKIGESTFADSVGTVPSPST